MVDTRVPVNILNAVGCILASMATASVPMIVTPQAAVPMLVVLTLYYFILVSIPSTLYQLLANMHTHFTNHCFRTLLCFSV